MRKINMNKMNIKKINPKKIAAFLGLTVMAGLILTACGTANKRALKEATTDNSANETIESTEDEYEADWYQGVLTDKTITDKYPYYSLRDINLDGKAELFLSTTDKAFIGAEDKACLIAEIDGKPVALQEIGGNGGEYWLVNQSDATLSYYSRLSGEEHIILYKLTDAGLSEIGSADYYAAHHHPEKDNDTDLYFLDNKETTKKEYESYFEQYGNKAGALTYVTYGENAFDMGDATIDYGDSKIYSQNDLESAMKVIQGEVAKW